MPVLGTRSFVMKVRSRQGVEKLAIGIKHLWLKKGGGLRSAINKPTTFSTAMNIISGTCTEVGRAVSTDSLC